MDFKNIPLSAQPAYTWLWNTAVTEDGIKQRIDEMYNLGIRAFYVLGEPENFRPTIRRTHLSPEYLSDEYIELVKYAFQYAKEKGVYMWLYNEGGFPSGMVCGKIRAAHPELAMKNIDVVTVMQKANEELCLGENVIAAFAGSKRVADKEVFSDDTELMLYCANDAYFTNIRTDNASLRNTELFIKMTHEKLKEHFGEAMGTDIKLMFDDEACMGNWTDGLEKIFFEKYGYDIADFMPYIFGDKEPVTESEHKANSDYYMLCGDLVRDNYFAPMKKWLNSHNMLSVGHLDNDHNENLCLTNRYGNAIKTLREYDIPGIDVIRNQITYPKDNSLQAEIMEFFPRWISSAARQCGHSMCLSESLAVYGAHVDPELMRYVVNYQAVRGVSLFNFMVMSYDRTTPMVHQYRPNFVGDNLCMNHLKEINDYTARISYILQNTKPDIKTALYYPARTICARGKTGKSAAEEFKNIGEMLEREGVSFDIIDEEIVSASKLENSCLVYNDIVYENVFVPLCTYEPDDVKALLSHTKSIIEPCILRQSPFIIARKVLFENGDEGYLICNTADTKACDIVHIPSSKPIYNVDLSDGEIYIAEHCANDGSTRVNVELNRGEALFLLFSERNINACIPKQKEYVCTLSDFESYVSREYKIGNDQAITNTYFSNGTLKKGLYEWDADFSGEVTYTHKLSDLTPGTYELDLGQVSSVATLFIDGVEVGKAGMPPYTVSFELKSSSADLSIIVSNTCANECVRTDYFSVSEEADVGPYHENMNIEEKEFLSGGLIGPVVLKKLVD